MEKSYMGLVEAYEMAAEYCKDLPQDNEEIELTDPGQLVGIIGKDEAGYYYRDF